MTEDQQNYERYAILSGPFRDVPITYIGRKRDRLRFIIQRSCLQSGLDVFACEGTECRPPIEILFESIGQRVQTYMYPMGHCVCPVLRSL